MLNGEVIWQVSDSSLSKELHGLSLSNLIPKIRSILNLAPFFANLTKKFKVLPNFFTPKILDHFFNFLLLALSLFLPNFLLHLGKSKKAKTAKIYLKMLKIGPYPVYFYFFCHFYKVLTQLIENEKFPMTGFERKIMTTLVRNLQPRTFKNCSIWSH